MNIYKIRDNIKKLVLEEFNKRDNVDTDKLSIIGDDYHNRLLIAQELERLKLIIYPYYKECKYCGEKFETEHVVFRGDQIMYCNRENKECNDKWTKDYFSPEYNEWIKQFDNAESASFTFDNEGNMKKYHITKKDNE